MRITRSALRRNVSKYPRPFPFITPRPDGLTERQAAFAEFYAIDPNGKRAAIEVGVAEKSAPARASEWRQSEPIRAYIDALRSELADGAAFEPGSREWIRARMVAIASVSAADLLVTDADGSIRYKRPDELSAAQRAAVADVSITQIGGKHSKRSAQVKDALTDEPQAMTIVTGYKLHSAAAALDQLARVEGLHAPAPAQKHEIDVRHVFEAVARSEDTSETSARLRLKHGAAGAVIEGEAADVRPLRQLRGV